MITPNHLTIVRIIIALALPYLLIFHKSPIMLIIAVVGFVVACITDYYDGQLARAKAMESDFGKIADPIADKILVLGLMAVFCYYKLYGILWIVFIFIREISVTITRLVLFKRGKVIPAEQAGKFKVGAQIASVYFSFAFWTALDIESSWMPVLAGIHFAMIFYANAFTMYSGILFFYALRKNES